MSRLSPEEIDHLLDAAQKRREGLVFDEAPALAPQDTSPYYHDFIKCIGHCKTPEGYKYYEVKKPTQGDYDDVWTCPRLDCERSFMKIVKDHYEQYL